MGGEEIPAGGLTGGCAAVRVEQVTVGSCSARQPEIVAH